MGQFNIYDMMTEPALLRHIFEQGQTHITSLSALLQSLHLQKELPFQLDHIYKRAFLEKPEHPNGQIAITYAIKLQVLASVIEKDSETYNIDYSDVLYNLYRMQAAIFESN